MAHRTALSLLATLAALGGLTLTLGTSAPVAVTGLLLLGFSLAGMLPTLLEWGGRNLGLRAAGVIGTFAYAGMLLEPLMATLLGEHLRLLFLGIPLLMTLATLALLKPSLERVLKPVRLGRSPYALGEVTLNAAGD